uniref:Uncharacterized protein n=1 Tax=Romanomermis culicivorax TaxID=13658 RepID=A0A915KDB0_ROMCU
MVAEAETTIKTIDKVVLKRSGGTRYGLTCLTWSYAIKAFSTQHTDIDTFAIRYAMLEVSTPIFND